MTPLDWQINSRYGPDGEALLGALPRYINALSPEPAYRQIDAHSISGWHPESPFSGWEMTADDYLHFPGLPALEPVAFALHGLERIIAYPAGFVAIVELSGAFSVARIL